MQSKHAEDAMLDLSRRLIRAHEGGRALLAVAQSRATQQKRPVALVISPRLPDMDLRPTPLAAVASGT